MKRRRLDVTPMKNRLDQQVSQSQGDCTASSVHHDLVRGRRQDLFGTGRRREPHDVSAERHSEAPRSVCRDKLLNTEVALEAL